MSDAAMLWDGIHLILQKVQRKVLNYAAGKYLNQKGSKKTTVYFCGFYTELNVLILYLKTGDRKFVFSEMM